MNRHTAVAECAGTAILVGLGLAGVHLAVLGHLGLHAVALLWGVAVAAALLACGPVHANPAVTLALAAAGRLPWREAPLRIAGQCAGAVIAAASVRLALVPEGALAAVCIERCSAPVWQALLAEAAGTALIVAVIHLASRLPRTSGIVCVATAVALAIIVVAPLTQAGLNPARDLAPRLVALASGQATAITPASLLVYVAGPIIGAVATACVLMHQEMPCPC